MITLTGCAQQLPLSIVYLHLPRLNFLNWCAISCTIWIAVKTDCCAIQKEVSSLHMPDTISRTQIVIFPVQHETGLFSLVKLKTYPCSGVRHPSVVRCRSQCSNIFFSESYILCGASLGRGRKFVRGMTKVAATPIYGKKNP